MPQQPISNQSHQDDGGLATVPLTTGPLVQLMIGLGDLVKTLNPEQYTAKPELTKCGAIGGHVRHTVDHLAAWLGGIDRGLVNYDARERGTGVETDPTQALHTIKHHAARLSEIEDPVLVQPVEVLTSMTSCGSLVCLPSTHARELAFVFSHTIHHNAIIGTIARALGVEMPENFGMAPSTIAYRNNNGCAP